MRNSSTGRGARARGGRAARRGKLADPRKKGTRAAPPMTSGRVWGDDLVVVVWLRARLERVSYALGGGGRIYRAMRGCSRACLLVLGDPQCNKCRHVWLPAPSGRAVPAATPRSVEHIPGKLGKQQRTFETCMGFFEMQRIGAGMYRNYTSR